MAIEDSVIYQKKTLPAWAVGNKGKTEEKKDEKKTDNKSGVDILAAPVREQITTTIAKGSSANKATTSTPKKTTEKKNSTKSTTPAVFKPRTLLETTVSQNKESTRQNTNNRFESRFTPSTVKNTADTKKSTATSADGLSSVSRLNSLTSDDVEHSRNIRFEKAQKTEQARQARNAREAQSAEASKVSGWRPEFDRSGAMSSDGDDEVKQLAKDPKKLEAETNAEYINNGIDDDEKDRYRSIVKVSDYNKERAGQSATPVLGVMSEDEQTAYFYLRGKYGSDTAWDYLKSSGIQDRYIKYNDEAATQVKIKENSKDAPVTSYIATYTLAMGNVLVGGSKLVKETINNIVGSRVLDTSSEDESLSTDTLGTIQQGRLESTDSKTLQFAYNAGDMLVREAAENTLGGKLEKATGGLFNVAGLFAGAGDKYTEVAQYGGDTSGTDVYVAAVTSGLMDAFDLTLVKKGGRKLTGTILKDMPMGKLKTIIGNTAGSLLSGAGVGFTRSTIDNIVDAVVLDDKGRYENLYQGYKQSGLSDEDAQDKAFNDAYVQPVVNGVFMGGILGLATSALPTAQTAISFTNRGRQLKQSIYGAVSKDVVKGMTEGQAVAYRATLDDGIENAVIRQGSMYDKNSAAAQNAQLLQNRLDRGKKLTDSQIGAQDILNRAEEYKFAMKTEAARKLTGVNTSYDGKLDNDFEGSYSNGEIKLSTNPQDDYNSTFDHEMLHAAEDGANDIYNIYAQRIRENAQYSVARDRIKGQYQAAGRKVSDDTLDSEVSAEILRKAMPKTAEDYDRLIRRVEGNPTLHDRMYNAVRNLRIKMYAMGGKVFTDPDTGFKIEYSELLNMEKTLENALMGLRGAELKGGETRFSIKNIVGEKGEYGEGVYLDTDVFDGIKPRNWNTVLAKYVYENFAGKSISVRNSDGTAEEISFAKKNDRVKKDGSSNFRRVIDELARTKGNINSLGVVHIEELLQTSRDFETNTEHSHQWLDENGWEIKKAYMIDKHGNIYETLLNIAKAKDGRKILYALSNTKRVDGGEVPSASSEEGLAHNINSDNSIPQDGGDVKYRLKTNQDMNVYGRNVIDDLNAYNRKRGYGSAFNDLINGILPDVIRQSWRLFENGEVADGRKLLYSGGEEIAQKVHHKKGETDHIIATDFVEHFTELYKQSRTIKAYEGRLDASTKDITETGVDVPRYVAELTTKNYANADLMLTLHIESAIRSGYRLLKNGSDDFAIREALRPAAETILNESKTREGNYLKFETEAEYNAAVNKLTDDIIENYRLEQPAKNVTDSEVVKADTKKYGKDIEGLFRGIGLGITEGSVKRLGGSVRQMLDFVLDEDYNVTDFNGKLDEVIGAELTKLKVSPADKAEIANTIICELREIAMSKIGKRRLELRGIMQAEIEAGRDNSEAWQNAHDELGVLAIREANLTGVYFPHGNPGNDYALRNPAKKLHKINVGSKEEFDSAVKERMGEMTYRISHNKDTADYGMRYVAMNGTMESFTYLSSKQKWDENDMGIAAALVGEFGALGEPQLEADVLILASQKATEAGKLSQAFSLMYRLTPAGNIAFLNKTEQSRIQIELERHPQKAEIEKEIEASQAKDAEERKAADKALYETDAEYRRDSDNKTRLQQDLEAAAKGEEEAKAKIAEYEELNRKNKLDKEFLAFMSGSGWRVENRRRQKLLEDGARDTMREIGMSEDDIEMYMTAVDVSPEKHNAFIRTLRDYMSQSESFLLRKEGEYQKWLVSEGKNSREAKKLRREIRQIAIRQRSVQNDHIVRAYRVNDDGELDPKGKHIVSDNPKASKWEIKKALGEDASHEAAEHYRSHVDMLYDKLGIKHTDSENFSLMRELANALPDIEDADELIDIIMITSRYRKTATGSRMEKIRSKMYRGLDKIGEKYRAGFTPVGETLDLRAKSMSETEGEPDNRMLKWLLGFGDKETNNIRKLLRKHFGNDTEQLKKIATSQMFGMIADTENVSTGRKLKNVMFQNQLIHPPTIDRNVLGNIAESARMNIVNNAAAAIDWLTTRKGGQRVVGFENPFAGYKEGKARSEKSYLETALNVDILNNDHSRLGTPSKKRTFKRGPLAVGERILGYSLGATDEYFKGAIYEQVRSGLDRYVKDGRITEAEAEEYAQQQMLYRTFQNESLLARISVGLRDVGNFAGTGKELPDTNKSKLKWTHDFGLGDFINPYPLVSGNVLDRVIDVTPVGAVKALVKCGKLAKELYANNKDVKALEGVDNKHVRDGMSDEERYKILANKTLKNIPKVNEERVKDIETKLSANLDNASEISKSDRKRLFVKIGNEFGVYKDYTNEDIELSFEFTRNGMRESENKQKGNYRKFAKMFSCFDDVIDRAIGIEVHNRNKDGYKPDKSLKEMYVLVSAFKDGEHIVPVKLEIKEYNDRTNKLYVAVALESIKKNEVVKQEYANNSVTQVLARSDISVSQLLKNVNPKDKSFTKYIPKEFFEKNKNADNPRLPDSILQAKRDALLSVANALISPVGWWLGAQLFKSGILLGGEPSENEEDYERAKMNTQWTINFGAVERLINGEGVTLPQQGDYIMPISFLGPSASVLTFGAEAFGNDTDEPIIDKICNSTGESVYAEFMAMSSVSGMRRYINDWKYADTKKEGAAAIAADAAMSFMPSTVRAVGNALDDYNRDPYRADSQLGVIGGKFLSKVPITELRENVPLRIDLWGEAEVHTLGKGKLVDIFNNALSPAIFSRYETNAVTQEIDRLSKNNKDLLNSILPKTPYRTNSGTLDNGQNYEFSLNDKDYQNYANLLGMNTYKAMHALITSDDYKHLTEGQKAEALSDISYNTSKLVKEVWVGYLNGDDDKGLQAKLDKNTSSAKVTASNVVKKCQTRAYLKLDGVKVEDVIDAGYYVPYDEESKAEQIGNYYNYITWIKQGTFKENGVASRYWTEEERQEKISYYERKAEDIASDAEQKWITIKGNFNELPENEQKEVLEEIEYSIDTARLPDNIGELVGTAEDEYVIDLTDSERKKPDSALFNLGWRADEYDSEHADKNNADAAEEDTEETKKKTVEDYLAEYKGSGQSYNNGYSGGYSRNYSKKNYSSGYSSGYSGSSGGYRYTPSIQPPAQNTYRFTPRFGGASGGGRFAKRF